MLEGHTTPELYTGFVDSRCDADLLIKAGQRMRNGLCATANALIMISSSSVKQRENSQGMNDVNEEPKGRF